ncbi:MAG: amidase [Rhodospirillaceae bacterium]|nr:amidase [Rhodospirillaceae bacterium]|tara:strand:- start:638 stop:1987 length:1350 start_codon:yes stop_codon:yes gene_type:complete
METTLAFLRNQLTSGKVTSRKLIESALAAIDETDGQGGTSFVKVYREQAIALADANDDMSKSGIGLPPLAGIPISVKDLFDISGEVTMAGSLVRENCAKASTDADVVSRLKAAGAVLVGRTNMTEFAFSGLGLNPHYGTPLNPWDRSTGRIPGGSSSGAAVSVTDHMAAAAIGTDTGGSVRIPSALCGVTGFKPTASRVSTRGAFPLSTTLDSIGPLAASVSCCALLDQIMRGVECKPVLARSIGRLTFGVPKTIVFDDVDSIVAATFEKNLFKLSELGARIIDVPFKLLDEITLANKKGGYAAVESFFMLENLLEKHESKFDPRVASRIKRGATVLGIEYLELRSQTTCIQREANQITREFDALLMPTVPVVAPKLIELEQSDELYHKMNLLMLRNSSLWNFLDRCAVSIPIHEKGSAPVGLMVVGDTGGDEALLEVAKSIEQALGRG